jgi:DNA-binding helix-hairpin-helix protein with protein kinase domain
VSAAEVPLASLRLGERLGVGGQGEVFRLRDRPGEVLKRYFSTDAETATLDALVAFPGTLAAHEREALSRQTAWPSARVSKHGRTVGCLMKEAPGAFLGRTAAGPKLRELQYLLFPRTPLWGDIVPLGTQGRIDVAQHFAALIRIFQNHGMVVGDISMSNLLWSPGAQIYLIDCDSPTPVGMASVLPPTDTPDWHDPHRPPGGQSLDTDRYKLALVIGRTLAADAYVRPGRPLNLPGDVPGAIASGVRALFARAAGPHGERPGAEEWARALRGRGEIAFGPAPVRATPPDPPKAGPGGRGGRPVITF